MDFIQVSLTSAGLVAGDAAWEAISCLGKPALWPGSPNLETITVGLPASAAQRLHRFNKSVHIG